VSVVERLASGAMTQPRRREPDPPYSDRDAPRRNGGAYTATRADERRSRAASRSQPAATGLLAVRWGKLPGRFGVFVVIGSAAVGALLTAVSGSAPGIVLGICLVAGTVAGALAVRPRAGYLIIPVPALAYLGAALIAGLIYNRTSDGSRTLLALNGSQWIASGFVAMSLATAVAIVIMIVRWCWSASKGHGSGGSYAPARRRAPGQRADRAV
jgi:hypothetical protein